MAEKTIDTIENDDSQKKSLLLHSCCGPCSTAVLERLEAFRVRILYYNPNITDPKEYALRLSEQKRFLKESEEAGRPHVELTEGGYDPQVFFEFVKGLEQEPEGGARCRKCFELRLRETARMASELGFDCFDTTMSVSPYKNYDVICQLGRELEKEYGVEFLAGNYKKKDGYHRSILLSKEYGLYRQDYCGCVYSRLEAEAKRRERESRQ
ncbi:MAG: epoxyqueuosine reductase QueH [Firmicutes bacterium]|nr:epoxyqueuosine reductase QueH [Bacillota bacterium]